jgi:glucosamine--fructose-6-phosphate aminotransferase (isomerizing)
MCPGRCGAMAVGPQGTPVSSNPMCGIVAVLRRPSSRPVPDPAAVVDRLTTAVVALAGAVTQLDPLVPAALDGLALVVADLEGVDDILRGVPGLQCLLAEDAAPGADRVVDRVAELAAAAVSRVEALEAAIDAGVVELDPIQAEAVNGVLLRLKDVTWAIARDRVGMARAVADLAQPGPAGDGVAGDGTDRGGLGRDGVTGDRGLSPGRLAGLWSIEVALGSLDRLEVRGRDSAGLHVLVHGHGLHPDDPVVAEWLGSRLADPLFTSQAVRTPSGCLSLVYKTAAEIGELGDNVRALRRAIRSDPLLALALGAPGATTTVIGHTRWASVGIISEANAHPLNSEESDGRPGPYVTAALNGDVDNHASLRLSEALSLPAEVTTDAKIIPTLVSRRMAAGVRPLEAFTSTVVRFEGSVAIAASLADTPDEIHLALRGSGQSLYVGLAEDAFVVASEAYGLVEETPRFVRMDGESTQGQTVVLDRSGAGTVAGMTRCRYDGGGLPVVEGDVVRAEITTRDIDRAGFSHFLLKEIGEAPRSFRRTLRGRVHTGPDGRWEVQLGPDSLPASVVDGVATGAISRVVVIGQGTAAVAGQAMAAALRHCLPDRDVTAMPATELSGFGLRDDMADTLVVAVSQSGSTTDTNRTVDLVRGRGAQVIAVVNRRNSDLSAKSHGVLHTSDGRDVEMSVASTKAFYAQVAAGWLLALALARAAGSPAADEDHLVATLRELPAAMEQVLRQRHHIGEVAAAVAPSRRSWAMVGSGPDRVAAAEVRIKLSELCYRAIACDATEDKKHIDLSSEPMILVFAGGLSGPNADDVSKEVAIYRAHKAAPVVVACAGEGERFSAALEVIEVPRCDPKLAFVLSAMVGHLFGYEAALAIDAQALPLREARAAIESVASGAGSDVDSGQLLEILAPVLARVTRPFVDGLRAGAYNGNLDAATAVRISSLLRFAVGLLPLDAYEVEWGRVGTPSVLVSDLFAALSAGIDELTRPIDAIKHQAKTVTVGISRSEDALLRLPLVKEALAAGAQADQLGYRALRTLAALDAGVEAVLGYTRYVIQWTDGTPGTAAGPTIAVIDQGGEAKDLPSRTATDPRLRGTKHRASMEREVTVARGRHDGRTVIMIPETRGTTVTGMTLLHVRFAGVLDAGTAQAVLAGYRDRLVALVDAVTETEQTFDDARLGQVPIVELLTEPVYSLAERRWRTPS